VLERVAGEGAAVKTAIGHVPAAGALDMTGLRISPSDLQELLAVKPGDWLEEIGSIREHYAQFGDRLPSELNDELTALEARLNKA
jgi:phosphoenolpyruvate carboxykinase (GTP)